MKHSLLIAVLTATLAVAPPSFAVGMPTEGQLKAAYLFNFAKFITWPEDHSDGADAPIVIGVIGNSPIACELGQIKSKTVKNRPIVIHRYQTLPEVLADADCHMLYLCDTEAEEIRRILGQLGDAPVVTVSDASGFVEAGGQIQLVTKRHRLKFIINLDAIRERHIKIDSRLLSLALEVRETTK